MEEDATLGNYEGTTVVQLVKKTALRKGTLQLQQPLLIGAYEKQEEAHHVQENSPPRVQHKAGIEKKDRTTEIETTSTEDSKMATAKQRTGSKVEEQVTLIVVYDKHREAFTFYRSTKVRDALGEVVQKFQLSEPQTISLLHCGSVMKEDATLGNYEGATVVQLVKKTALVTSVRTAIVEGIQDHDKYFGFCSVCKSMVNVRPIVNHCNDGKFVFHSTAPDYHSVDADLTGKCLACQVECKAKVSFQCMSCQEHHVAFLRLVRKNTPRIPCMKCSAVGEIVFVFPCPSRHCMCLTCFVNYCQAMMNSDLFCTFPEVGYSICCPAPDAQCKESPVLDPHHFCLVDNKGSFYANYKDKSCSHLDLPDTSILCHCKKEIDMSSGTEGPHTAPVPAAQEDVAGIGWFRSLLRFFSGPVRPPPPSPPVSRGRKRVSCRGCQEVYCCECKMTWHEGKCQQITETMKEEEKFKVDPTNALKGRWPKYE